MPSPNPRGRPRTGLALAEAIRERVDPVELIALALELARGMPVVRDIAWMREKAIAEREGRPAPELRGEVLWPSHAERLAALSWLADRGWQKPVVATETTINAGTAAPTLDYGRLSQAELDDLERLHAKAAGVVTPAQVAGALAVVATVTKP